MKTGKMGLLACTILPGAFSGERVFRFEMAEDGEYVGIAPVGHCRDEGNRPLGRGVPAPGEEIPGFVDAYFISNGGDVGRVELPDGVAVRVRLDQLKEEEKPTIRGLRDVSVGS